jgi:hypothetical protein
MRPTEWEQLDARVKRLEKQNRWLKLSCLSSFLIFACMLTMGGAKVGSTLEAQRFASRQFSRKRGAEPSADTSACYEKRNG